MLLLLSSAQRVGDASGFARDRAFKTIRFGTIFGAVGPLLILTIESVRGRSLGLRELGSTLSR